MNVRRTGAIFRKELVDMLRDRRTVVAMIGVPIVLYPLLFIFGSQAAMLEQDKLARSVSRVAIESDADPTVREWVEEIPMVRITAPMAAADALYRGDIEAVVGTSGNTESAMAKGESVNVNIRYDAADTESRQALRRLADGLGKENDRLLDERLTRHGFGKQFVRPVDVKGKNVAPPAKTTGALLGTILPMIMVIMLGVGAFYPAIDLTAGEKERGTFETLLSTPTTTTEIVCGKFLTVFCLSVLAGLLNLGSLLLTLGFQFAQLDAKATQLAISLPPETVVLIALVLIPLAFFISAVMMTVAMFARSFKEAQNFVTPFFMLIMFPAVFAAIPGTELTPAFYFVPIANVALLFKDLMTQQGDPQEVFAVFLSTVAYAAMALLCAVWIFKHEEMILAEEHGLPLTLRRSHFVRRAAPTPGMVLFLYSACLLLNFYAGTYFARNTLVFQEPLLNPLITEWALILAPTVLYLAYTRVNLISTLNLRRPPLGALLGAAVASLSWAALVIQLGFWQEQFLPTPKELTADMAKLFQGRESGIGLAMILFALAVSPAVCEETLFRGALLSGFRRRMPDWAVMLLVGLLFGVLHISIHKIAVTAASGVLLTYLVLRSNSIFTSMTAHFLLNGTAIMAATRFEGLMERHRVEQEGVPALVLLIALAGLALGIALVEMSTRTRRALVAREAEQAG